MVENSLLHEMGDIMDDRPLAVRRKRRISTGLVDPVDVNTVQPSAKVDQSAPTFAKSPSKAKKRVRFSDPGLETSTTTSSTGLTPYLKKTSFTSYASAAPPSTPQLLATASRRRSLPSELSTSLPSPSLSPSPISLSGEVQFAPLRQVLDDRLKRRLRRNNLSEEINGIDEEKRSETRWAREIHKLKGQLFLAKQEGKEHGDEIGGATASAERIQALEQELASLKEETRERSRTVEPIAGSNVFSEAPSPEMDIFIDGADDFVASNFDDDGTFRDEIPIGAQRSVNEAATQAALPSPSLTETFRSARISLEYLFPGEIALGLIPEDPKPLLDIMLERMRNLKAQAVVAEETLATTQSQESNLRNQFNAVLAQLDRARIYAEDLSTRHSNEKARADNAQARVQMLEIGAQKAISKFTEIENDADEKDRSIRKLQDALDSYRLEVGKLEMLITKIEGDHSNAMSKVRAEMGEAVADLECHVAAETRGRREAEQEVVDRDDRIKQLKVQEQELKDAVNEKQRVIRETEAAFSQEKVDREREVGGMNVTIGQLSAGLSEAKIRVAKAEQKHALLIKKLQVEQNAGLQAVLAIQGELAVCAEKAEDVKTAHISEIQRRGAEVTEHKGLLTPVIACRFKNVEGYVEVRRGKGKRRHPDSGIGVLEDEDGDENEDIMMADEM